VSALAVRVAGPDETLTFGRMLHRFNAEYDQECPEPEVLARRASQLIESGDIAVLFAGEGPDGFLEVRFYPMVYADGLFAHVDELYVVPDRRGHGLGRALLDAAMDLARERGADHIDLTTAETDTAARGLYESAGFTNREFPNEAPMLYYERDL
jgi:ribosomal protein S18 acetylase RimI-like enzyme